MAGVEPRSLQAESLWEILKFKLAKQFFSSYLIDQGRRNPLIYEGFVVTPP